MKKLYIAFILFLLMPVMVFATQNDDLYYYDDTNTYYIVQCSYSNTQTNGVAELEFHYYHSQKDDDYGKWGVVYHAAGDHYGQNGCKKGPDWFGNVFSDKGSPNIYMPSNVNSALKDKHTCPKSCYLDTKSRDEICCDNGDGWCTKNHTNIATYFANKNDKYISDKKESDKQEDTAKELEEHMNDGVTDEVIENGKEAVNSQITENIDKVLDEAYGTDKGGEISDADKQYYQDNKETITEKPKKDLTSQINRIKEQLEKDYQNGLIDEDTYNSKKQNLEDFTDGNINDLYDNIFDYNFSLSIHISEQNCKSMLGDPQTNGTPAFYLVIAFTIIKYVAIILLIVLTIMDYASAVASHDNDMIKKATSKAILRAILCIVIFLLPTLIEFVLKYLNERAVGLCGIK